MMENFSRRSIPGALFGAALALSALESCSIHDHELTPYRAGEADASSSSAGASGATVGTAGAAGSGGSAAGGLTGSAGTGGVDGTGGGGTAGGSTGSAGTGGDDGTGGGGVGGGVGDGGCVAETNPAFCSRLGKNCGNVTGTDNCGAGRTVACGMCSTPYVCGVDNVCACGADGNSKICGTTCVNIKIDSANCGDCGHVCDPPVSGQGAAACLSGTCNISCTSGMACGKSCVDINSDFYNCGGCGKPCASNSVCVNAFCRPKLIVTDSSWLTMTFNGSAPPPEWTLASFDDSAWHNATIVGNASAPPSMFVSGFTFSAPAQWIWDSTAGFYDGIFVRKKFVAATSSMTVQLGANKCWVINGADPPPPATQMFGDLQHQCFDFPKMGDQYTIAVNPGQTYYLAIRAGNNIVAGETPNGLIGFIQFK
jgi:hypothetical protein